MALLLLSNIGLLSKQPNIYGHGKYCHTIAVAASSFLLFEKPSRNPTNPTGFMAAGLGFEPKDGLSPSPDFKASALNQTLPSRHNLCPAFYLDSCGQLPSSLPQCNAQMAVSRAIPFNCQQVGSTISWEHIDSTTLLMVCQGVFENYFLEGSR